MNDFKRISVTDANQMIADNKHIALVDIRDEVSFNQSHLLGATHLSNHNLQTFIEATDPETPVLIYCYHGNSSQNAAHYLANQGFQEVYSVDGGYEVWRNMPPHP